MEELVELKCLVLASQRNYINSLRALYFSPYVHTDVSLSSLTTGLEYPSLSYYVWWLHVILVRLYNCYYLAKFQTSSKITSLPTYNMLYLHSLYLFPFL